MIQQAGPGGTVQLLADQGNYTLTKELYLGAGGGAGSQVTIMGVDSFGQPMNATISSSATAIFVLRAGADNLAFEYLTLKDTTSSVGAIRIGANISNLTIEHVDAYNVRTFLGDVASGTATSATVSGLVVRDVNVHGYSETGIALGYNSNNILIENVVLEGKAAGAAAYMEGVHLEGTVHNVVLQNVTASGNIYAPSANSYWNGDGFATEAGVYDVHFINTVATGNADAGYDLKSSATTLDGVVASDNARNFRFWSGDIIMTRSTGSDPHKDGGTASQAQVWLGEGATATISNSTFTDQDPKTTVFDLSSKNATLNLIDDAVVKDPGGTFEKVYTGSSVNLLSSFGTAAFAMADSSQTPIHNEGTTGADKIVGGAGSDYLRGGDGNDQITGGASFDDINGNAGADTLWGGDGNDWVVGGKDADLLYGDAGNDIVYGNLGADTCVGGAGDDLIRGGQQNDSLSGGDGADWLSGDLGADTISGGAGADTFHSFSGAGLDRITDFSSAAGDRVQLDPGTQYTLKFVGQDTIIDMGGGDSVVLLGVTQATLGTWLHA